MIAANISRHLPMHRLLRPLFGVTIALAMFVFRCTDMQLAGSVSETTNGYVVGTVVDSTGLPVMDVQVRLLIASYNPVADAPLPDSLFKLTDEAGMYRISFPARGAFNIEATLPLRGTSALVIGIVSADGKVAAPKASLKAPGAVTVILPDSAGPKDGYVYIPGTTRWSPVTNGMAAIDKVPAGPIPAVRYADAADTTRNHVIQTDLTVSSGLTVKVVDFSAWKYSLPIYLNTTTSGAGVSGNVTNFPVLVRLSSSNFDFSRAQPHGEDLRITKADSTPLPCEIESWDSAKGLATVWVKVDTVYGNNSGQYIRMFWGNPFTPSASNGASVFDAAAGFLGVWHLNGNCADASAHGNNGTASGTIDTAGMVGGCKKFSNGDYIKIPGLLGTPQSITLSAWAKLDTVTGNGGEIISLGDAVLLRLDDTHNSAFETNGSFHYRKELYFIDLFYNSPLQKSGWHFVTFTMNSSNKLRDLYIDGTIVASDSSANFAIEYAGVGSDTYIGKFGMPNTVYDLFNFIGTIDEVRAHGNAVSANWVKLCYENQKANDALLKFK